MRYCISDLLRWFFIAVPELFHQGVTPPLNRPDSELH